MTTVSSAQAAMNAAVADCLEVGLDLNIAVQQALNSQYPGPGPLVDPNADNQETDAGSFTG